MSDGQPPVAPLEENAIAQTAQTEVVPEPDENVPEKFRGKSKSEIAQSYAELENKLGTQGTQLSELQRQVEDFQRQSVQARPGPQPEQIPDTSPYESMYYENPVKATQKMIADQDQRSKQQVRYAMAFNSVDPALNEARRKYPQAFEGMDDNDVAQLRQGILQNVSSGSVAPEVLASSTAWAGAATLQRGLKTGFNFRGPGEVSATPTESPAAVKNQAPPVEDFSPDERTQQMMRKMGLSKEQQTEAVKRATTEFDRYRR